jgi:FtsP/CotA-like multicopper oxidase with cupredoxin domain
MRATVNGIELSRSMRLRSSWRRCFVAGAIVASGLALAPTQHAAANDVPFSQPLRIPPVYTTPNVDITMREACVQVLPGPCTKMWTYDGGFPGPTIRRPSGTPTRVTFANELPAEVGSTTVHHHGSHSESQFDGQPDDHLIPRGEKFTYKYDFMEGGEPERAAFQWYHDHRMDNTGRNVWMGLAGMFVLDDDFDASLPLPKGKYDVPLMVVDRSFDEANQLHYAFSSTGVTGDHILVNGVAAPYFEVTEHKYRLRLLNASNFREYKFEFANGQEMIQVASESGLLPKAVHRKSITLGPAERAEIVVDFAGRDGQDIELKNTADPVKTDKSPVPSHVMQFRVRKHTGDNTSVPETLRPAPQFGDPGLVKRVFTLGAAPGAGALHHPDDAAPQHFLWTINGKPFDPGRVDARPKLGSTERWVFVNPTVGLHRVHIHDVDWKIVSRHGGAEVLTPGDPDVALGEAGLKETFLVQSFETVEVEAKFTDHIGKYMFHCHILEHEDNGMMAQFEVMPTGDASPAGAQSSGPVHAPADAAPRAVRAATLFAHADRTPAEPHTPDDLAETELRQATDRHAQAATESARGGQTAIAMTIMALGVAAGALGLQRNRPTYSKVVSAALALQLIGLAWDMLIHAAAGESLDLFENTGHLVAAGGIVLLAVVVGVSSTPPVTRE